MIKEIPLLYSTPMVIATMEGRKTNTRRTIGLDAVNENPNDWEFVRFEDNAKGGLNAVFKHKDSVLHTSIPCRYGRQGSLLWVRENFRVNSWVPDDGELTFRYEADGAVSPYLYLDTDQSDGGIFNRYWKQSCDDLLKAGYQPNAEERFHDYDYKALRLRPSIHIPKEAARIWLQVESVRVERLQDISEQDAIAEGIKSAGCEDHLACPSKLCIKECVDKGHWWNYLAPDGEDFPCFIARESFQSLWQSINGPDSWHPNPWTWVIKFTVLSTTGKPLQTT